MRRKRRGEAARLRAGQAKQCKRHGAESDRSLSGTQAGLILGTPAYMSPEQAQGRVADARSDVFSLGTILYEMLSGRRAFPGTSVASVLGAILHRNPDPMSAARVGSNCLQVPGQVSRRPLSKRNQPAYSAGASGVRCRVSPYGKAMRRWWGLAALACVVVAAAGLGEYWKTLRPGPIDSIAVIPFSMQNEDAEADYISDGISESINNSLAQLPNLKVIPNSAALNYKGKAADFQKVGQQLGVQSVLSGRVVEGGNRLSINIELDDVRSGKQRWGQQYMREVADLLAVQKDISSEVSQKLRSRLSESDQQRLTLGSMANPDAYQLYLKGQHYSGKFTKDGFNKGIDYLNQAIALDPNYAEAYSELAMNYINQDDWFIPPKDSGPKARRPRKRR